MAGGCLIGRCLWKVTPVGWWWCGSLQAALVSPRMAPLRLDFGLLMEPLGFIKVLEWVSRAGKALFSLWGCFFFFPRPGFVPVSWMGRAEEACAHGLPTPCLMSLVVDDQCRAALQPGPLAGRKENSPVDT